MRLTTIALALLLLLAIASPSKPVAVPAPGTGGGQATAATGTTPRLSPLLFCHIGLVAAPADSPSTTLRLTLGRLLAEHAFLVLEAIRATTLNAPDLAQATAALGQNSSDLEGAVGSVYGPGAQSKFTYLWQQHIDLVLQYAHAKATGDQAGQQAASTALAQYVATFGSFLTAANPKLDAQAEAQALQLHIQQLLAYASADYSRAYDAQRAAFDHMFAFGDAFARAISDQFPQRYTGGDQAFAPAAFLRTTLDRLLAEHMVLAAEAMRTGLTGAPDASAARAALDQNTSDLQVRIGAIYGNDAGSAFAQVWSQHVAGYLALIQAIAAGDDAARTAAIQALQQYQSQITTFLEGASPPLAGTGLSDMLGQHIQTLIDQTAAYHAGDYATAYSTVRGGYQHMFDIGRVLAVAIATQFPSRYPSSIQPPATSEAARRSSTPMAPIGLSVLLTAFLASLAWLRLRTRTEHSATTARGLSRPRE